MEDQSLKQRKISLATSEHASVVAELIKDCLTNRPLIADTEWQTIVNALTLEIESNLIIRVVEQIERIRQGSLHDEG